MSMTTLTLCQLAGMSCAYLSVTVGLPAFVFGRKLCRHRAPERFLLYFMTGNFFIMNLVFLLQLLKISHPVTLILGTVLPAIIIRIKVNHIPVKEKFQNFTTSLRRLAGGQMGIRTGIYKIGGMVRGLLCRFCRWAGFYLSHHFFDCTLIALLLAWLWYIYGTNLLEYYGYKASDLLVHNYWINALSDNDIFVAGVYPHGFHCVIYYLHAVFGIETFVLLRIFAFVQNVMLHLMLLSVLRLCCRSRYSAYAGTFAFAVGTYFKSHTYSRYYATLPQEFGIIFILPAIYFGFAFFEERRKELKAETVNEAGREGETETGRTGQEKGKGKEARKQARKEKREAKRRKKKERDIFSPASLALAGFCMSFSMTLAVHFYGTMVAGIFCAAMACGYFFLFLRKKYFWKVVSTVTVSVVIAVMPMLIAFLGGTPLQGSLGWGMNIIFGGKGSAQQQQEVQTPEPAGTGNELLPGEGLTEGELPEGNSSAAWTAETIPSQDSYAEQAVPSAPPPSLREKWGNFWEKVTRAWRAMENRLQNYVFSLPFQNGVHWIMISFLGLIGMGGFYILTRQVCYGAMLVSTGLSMLFMCVMLSASTFGLPSLMDGNRGSIYFAYTCPVALAFALDAVLYLPFSPLRGKAWKVGRVILNGLSLICVAGFLYYTVTAGCLKEPRHTGAQEMNETVVCLTNIIKNEKDFTWTIVSANDELRMGWDHGYHYETITFLQEMEMAPTDTLIRIPTQVVYFFIEKIPVDYNVSYAGSGQAISEEGASYMLPRGSGINVYQGMNRWIVMSRMYYWAERFRQLCPNEMDIYMETDNFICYRLEQDPNRLYNFALDYGYNTWGYRAVETAE